MEDQQQKDNQVVTDTAAKPKRGRFKLSRKKIAIIATIVLVSIGSGVGYLLYKENQLESQSSSTFPKQNVEMEQLAFEDLQKKVEALQASRQYAEARELIRYQDYYGKDQNAQWLYVAVCANQGDSKEALKALRNIEAAFDPSASLYSNIAKYAAELKDKTVATEYYKKAIEYTKNDASNPVREFDINQYQEKIDELKDN